MTTDNKPTGHERKTMATEIDRVQRLIAEAVNEIDQDGGSIRFFNAALMTAAMTLHSEVEGPASVEAALVKTAKRRLVADAKAGSC